MCFRPPNATKPIKCPRCNTLNPGGARKCRKCGLTEDEAVAEYSDKMAADAAAEQAKRDNL